MKKLSEEENKWIDQYYSLEVNRKVMKSWASSNLFIRTALKERIRNEKALKENDPKTT